MPPAAAPPPVTRPLTYSPSVTFPLTYACAWRCAYCGYRREGPREAGLLTEAEIDRRLDQARRAGATEALLISGEQPERWPHVRDELAARGHADLPAFARAVARRCLDAGLWPHSNLGALTAEQFAGMRAVTLSQGLMLENVDEAFNRRVAPAKTARGRLAAIAAAGEARVPFTSGILVGLGESPDSRRRSLDALAELHARYGHLQEILLQNFVPNRRSAWDQPTQPLTTADVRALVAHWRQVCPEVPVQIPPNLNGWWQELLGEIDDLGGISAEPDEVNPDSPWRDVGSYRQAAAAHGRELRPRPPVYPRFLQPRWIDPALWARWCAGASPLGGTAGTAGPPLGTAPPAGPGLGPDRAGPAPVVPNPAAPRHRHDLAC